MTGRLFRSARKSSDEAGGSLARHRALCDAAIDVSLSEVLGVRVVGTFREATRTVTDWLVQRLSRPIDCLVWHDSGERAARYWVFADGGGTLLGSGPSELLEHPETAEELVRVRP